MEAGATIYASKDHSIYSLPAPYTGRKDKGWLNSVFMGVDLEDISIEGRGTVDGQAEYEWRSEKMEYMSGSSHPPTPRIPLDVQGEIERRTTQPGSKVTWDNNPYFGHITYNAILAQEKAALLGQPLIRSFPKAYTRDDANAWYPHLIVPLPKLDPLSLPLRAPHHRWRVYLYQSERRCVG
jgi:hypothetical protein